VFKSLITATASNVELLPAPILPNWILEGKPEARCGFVGLSHDRTAKIMVWECSPGRFNWNYNDDEFLFIVSGEVFISGDQCNERRLSAGDIVFFQAGTTYTWRITEPVRKVAIVKKALPLPLALGARTWDKLLRTIGLRPPSPL
jgi:uncharacterized protein